MLLNDREVGSLTKQLSQPAEGNTDPLQGEELGSKFTPQLRVFTDIAGCSGVSLVFSDSNTDHHFLLSTVMH